MNCGAGLDIIARRKNTSGRNRTAITQLVFTVGFASCALVMFQFAKHINVLKPTGHVMHQQFNIQQLYALPTLYLCVLYLSENKQQLVPLTA